MRENHLADTIRYSKEFFADSKGNTGLVKQQEFYNRFIKNTKERTIVIISDALRYEVGQTLMERLAADEKCVATITAMQSVLPSYTRFGMSALLPHKELSMGEDYRVLADEKVCDDLKAREQVLQSYIPNSAAAQFDDIKTVKEAKEQPYVSVPEQGGGKLIPEGIDNPGHVYTVSRGKSGMVGVYRLETQVLPGNGKFERTGLGTDREAREATNTAFNFLKANGGGISGSISTTTKDYIINYQDLNGIGITKYLTLPTLIAICSAALGKSALSSLAVLGDMKPVGLEGVQEKVIDDYSHLEYTNVNGLKCTTVNQTIVDLLEKDGDEQIITECLANYYELHEESFKELKISIYLEEKFKKYCQWAVEYYEE